MDLAIDRAQSWRDDAQCRGVDAAVFFPLGSTGAAVGAIKAAQAVCRRCAVQEPCLEFAIETRQETGIWGGTTENERQVLRRAWTTRPQS